MQVQQDPSIPLGVINTDVDPAVDAGTRADNFSRNAPPTTPPPTTTSQAPPSNQSSSSQDCDGAHTWQRESQQPLMSRIKTWVTTTSALTNLVLVLGGVMIAVVYGSITQQQGNKSLNATLWRNCIDLPVCPPCRAYLLPLSYVGA